MFLLICKLYICIQNVFGHIFYSTRLHLYQQVWQFEVQKLAYMLILAAGGMIPYLSSVPPSPKKGKNLWKPKNYTQYQEQSKPNQRRELHCCRLGPVRVCRGAAASRWKVGQAPLQMEYTPTPFQEIL